MIIYECIWFDVELLSVLNYIGASPYTTFIELMNENNNTNTNINNNGSDYINNLKDDKYKMDEFKNHIGTNIIQINRQMNIEYS
jgi:hypothetical protein